MEDDGHVKSIRFSICVSVDEPDEVARYDAWMAKWKGRISISADAGCGCCVFLHDVEGSREALEDLGGHLGCDSEWSRSEGGIHHKRNE